MSGSLYTTVQGPKGKAEVYQLVEEDYSRVEFELRFAGQAQRFMAEGEAVMAAMELVGSPDQFGAPGVL